MSTNGIAFPRVMSERVLSGRTRTQYSIVRAALADPDTWTVIANVRIAYVIPVVSVLRLGTRTLSDVCVPWTRSVRFQGSAHFFVLQSTNVAVVLVMVQRTPLAYTPFSVHCTMFSGVKSGGAWLTTGAVRTLVIEASLTRQTPITYLYDVLYNQNG